MTESWLICRRKRRMIHVNKVPPLAGPSRGLEVLFVLTDCVERQSCSGKGKAVSRKGGFPNSNRTNVLVLGYGCFGLNLIFFSSQRIERVCVFVFSNGCQTMVWIIFVLCKLDFQLVYYRSLPFSSFIQQFCCFWFGANVVSVLASWMQQRNITLLRFLNTCWQCSVAKSSVLENLILQFLRHSHFWSHSFEGILNFSCAGSYKKSSQS